MSGPHITKCEDGSTLIEWLLAAHGRFYISIEADTNESSWGYVDRNVSETGVLPSAFVRAVAPDLLEACAVVADNEKQGAVELALPMDSGCALAFTRGKATAAGRIARTIRARGEVGEGEVNQHYNCKCPGCGHTDKPELRIRANPLVDVDRKLPLRAAVICRSCGATIGVAWTVVELDYPLVCPNASQGVEDILTKTRGVEAGE